MSFHKKETEKNELVARPGSDQDQGQVPRGLQRPPEAGAGERVSLQSLHHHQACSVLKQPKILVKAYVTMRVTIKLTALFDFS